MRRLHLDVWKNIIRNTNELGEDIEILWLDDTDEYVLCCDTEIFEDGFKDEREANRRLEEVQEELGMLLLGEVFDGEIYEDRYLDSLEKSPMATVKDMCSHEIVGLYLTKYGDKAIEWLNEYGNEEVADMPTGEKEEVYRILNVLINVRGLR